MTVTRLRHGGKPIKIHTLITIYYLRDFGLTRGITRQQLPPRPPNLTSFAWDNFSLACRLAFVITSTVDIIIILYNFRFNGLVIIKLF